LKDAETVLRCPVCKADNAQGPLCRRCKADLSLLIQLEEQRDALLGAAVFDLRHSRFEEALTNARRAHQLRPGKDSGRLLSLIQLLRYDFPSAWNCYVPLR
jgi:hypothetical protein